MRTLFACAFLALVSGQAQQVVSLQTSGDTAILTIRVKPANFVTVSGAPYSAKRITTGVQIRPDGNRVDENRTVLFYRDSAGRNRTEWPVSIPGSPIEIMIMDPTLGCEYVLDPGTKTAHKLVGVQVATRPASEALAMDVQERASETQAAPGNPGSDRSARTQTENLGTQTMQGLEVRGSRTTTTWPVGTLDNNDHEVVTTEESWWAPALAGVLISSKTSRPQLTENHSVSDVKPGDPDASLFAPPSGYRIVEESSDFQIRIPQTSAPAVTKLSSHGPAPAAISGAPFSGVRTNTATQMLPDGTREQHPERTVFLTWRDSQGRVRTEWPGQGTMVETVEIQDPIAGFTYSLDYVAKVARRNPFTQPAVPDAPAPANSQQLGSRTISGVPANGVKTTTVRAPGTAGATDKPLTNVTETWTAGKEGVALLEKTSTSAGNEATIELKHFSTLEPDPSLFQIPATYRIVDENGNQIAAATAHPPAAPADGTLRTSAAPAVRPNPGESVFTFRSQPGMNAPAMTRAPYSVETVSQNIRTLPDGTRSAPVAATTANYRDSMGRTRVERAQNVGGSFGPNAGATPPPPIVLPDVSDPVAGYRYILDPVHQVAHRMVIATRRINPAQATPVAVPAMPPSSQTTPDGMTITSESLGTQTVNGVLAMGMRSTITMPARAPQGNDHPTTTINESWSSVQYGTVLRSTMTGPNTESTTTAKELSQTEPDPALFQVPRDYKIVDEDGAFSITIPHPAQ